MKKPGIPTPQNDPTGVLRALKENVEIMAGRRGGKIAGMDTTNLTGVELLLAEKLNEILEVLQG